MPAKHTERARARLWFPNIGGCELCGAPATCRHHKNGKTGDNRRENLEFLCATHHRYRHWQMRRGMTVP